MREYSEALVMNKGLRPHFKTVVNSGELVKSLNFKPTTRGFLPYDPVVNPVNFDSLLQYDINLNWPFPQLFVGKSKILLADRTRIFEVDPFDWSIVELVTYNVLSQDDEKSIIPGATWSFIDMWDTWILSNGACTVFASDREKILGLAGKVFVAETPVVGCGCFHQGRVFLGGFDPTQFWNDTWKAFWASWKNKNNGLLLDYERNVEGVDMEMPVKDNFCWWSSIGAGDALSFFYPVDNAVVGPVEDAIYLFGGDGTPQNPTYKNSRPWLLEHWQRNEQGFAPMPYLGKVIDIRPLGQYVIVYSTGGIMALETIASPEPTMRQIPIGQIGVHAQGCVDGDLSKHLFIDQSGSLWLLEANLQLKPLGYREFFSPLLGFGLNVTFSADPKTTDFGEFYLGDGTKNYVYNGVGLYSTDQAVTSANYFQGHTKGFGSDMTVDTYVGELVYDRHDFNWPGKKHIESVYISLAESEDNNEDTADVLVAVDYRYAKTEQYKTTSYKAVNADGFVAFPVFGLDFRIRVKVNDFTRVDINGIRVNIKTSDKRYVRGLLSTSGSA